VEKKSAWWAYGFLFFFGALGAHRLYLDRPVSAVVYLLTGGFGGLGVVFDFFAMPFLIAAANK
jgi:TM2 domain-containing membrane protein YozV